MLRIPDDVGQDSDSTRTEFRSFRTTFRGYPDSFPAALSGEGPEQTGSEGVTRPVVPPIGQITLAVSWHENLNNDDYFSSWLRQISRLKMRVGSAGSAMRLLSVFPYQVVMLSLEIERQNTSVGSAVLVQRSMRAKSPAIRGR